MLNFEKGIILKEEISKVGLIKTDRGSTIIIVIILNVVHCVSYMLANLFNNLNILPL